MKQSSAMSDERVERAARAICAAATRLADDDWMPWEAEAKAALEAVHYAELVEAAQAVVARRERLVRAFRGTMLDDAIDSLFAVLAKLGGAA